MVETETGTATVEKCMAGNTADLQTTPSDPGTGQPAAAAAATVTASATVAAPPAAAEPPDTAVEAEGEAEARAERVLLLSPTGRDAAILKDQLVRRGYLVHICRDIAGLCEEIDAGAGSAFV